MVRGVPERLTSPQANKSAAVDYLNDSGNQEFGAALPVFPGATGFEADHVTQGQSPGSSTTKNHEQPMKTLMINEHAVNPTPASVNRPSGLPLRFIDQRELRDPSGSDLRKVVRSHARRDVDLRRRHIRDNLKARQRPLLEKKVEKGQPISTLPRNHAVDSTNSVITISTPGVSGPPSNDFQSLPLETGHFWPQEHSISPPLSRSFLQPSHEHDRANFVHSSITQVEEQDIDDLGFQLVHERIIEPPERQSRSAGSDHQASKSEDFASPSRDRSIILDAETEESNNRGSSLWDADSTLNTLILGSWRHDPFNVHGELNNPRVTFLLSHYNNVLNTVWVSSEKLLSFQTSKPGLIHATILFTASHLRALTDSDEYDRDILHHKGETIRIISSSLDDPLEQTSDQIIAALSSLILYEESYGSKQVASIHRHGLQQILKVRYAKPDLGIHRFVQHLLAYPLASADSLDECTTGTNIAREPDSIWNPGSEMPLRRRNTPLGHALTTSFLWLTNTAIRFESASYKSEDIYQIRQDIEEFLELCPNFPKTRFSFGFRSWLLAAMVYLHVATVPPSESFPLPRNEEEIVAQLKSIGQLNDGNMSPCSPRLWVLMLNGLYARSNDPVLLGSPNHLDLSTVSALHWCRAQLLLRDIPWAERRYKLEAPIEDDWEWVQANGFWRNSR
ncbi:hypothetical protein EG329_011802 [Mollisiaceae sp. DMI_Dod_QoI]|nr:hypothetical protein EG329_011802 [Helotiales sp. DMI_Dod_QoI]